jgi:GntR family transcriptional regulator, transcriptional repressor for pyruvate dehydrogenase complex
LDELMSQKKPETIGESLLTHVLRGDFNPDRPIPKELALAETYGMSRGTVRAALQLLGDHGIVSVVHGRPGAEVRPSSEWNLFDVSLLRTVLASPMRGEVLADLLECRQLVAGQAAALAAERATTDDIETLTACLDRVRDAVGEPRVGPLPTPELEFHRALMEAARNRFLVRAAMPLEAALTDPQTPVRRRDVTQLERVLSAVEAGDAAGARAAMRRRLESRRRT